MISKKVTLIYFIIMLALVVTPLAVFAQDYADAGDTTLSGRELLDQFSGRQFPNERPPRDEQVAAQAAGVLIGSDAVDDWYADFYTKNEKGGANPIAYARRMEALAQAEATGVSPMAAGLSEIGEAKMLMIPFEFNGSDTLDRCDADGNPIDQVTVEGPLHGTIPDPTGSGDNNTMWTDDFSTQWYQDLMFGDGVGVVRTDLNGGAGVDLTGVSAKNWYEEQSEGLYTIDGDIYSDWIQLDHSVAYYGWDGDELSPDGVGYPCDGTPADWGFQFAIDTVNGLNAVDPDFDWAQYDVDGDQIVDHLMIIHAGVDNSAGGGTYGNYQLWAHSWDMYCDNNGDGNLEYGCIVQGEDTPDDPSDDIYAANYTHIPEDADIGVVVHEYAHDIGLPDYYSYEAGISNSTAHWIIMSGGSWSGALGGSHPAPFNPWGRYFFGWADPMQIDYMDAATVMIGQADPTPADTEDSVWINLPDQAIEVPNMAGEGKGWHTNIPDLALATATRSFDLSGATGTVVFSFDTYYDIETLWDYGFFEVSTDGGATWTALPDMDGLTTDENPNGVPWWPGCCGITDSYEGPMRFDISSYAGMADVSVRLTYATDWGTQLPGWWVDNLSVDDDNGNLYFNDLEDGSDWMVDGWDEVPFSELYPHYYMLEWRNNTGSIAADGFNNGLYYSLAHDGDGWMVDKFSADVPGMLVWYRNNRYGSNSGMRAAEFDSPATGSKGELLLVDSHNDPIVWSGGWWDAGAVEPAPDFSTRRSSMDGAFTLDDTPAWMIHDYADSANPVMDFGSRPAVSAFHDSMRSVPGWVFPGDGFVWRADRDASVVIPGSSPYSTRIRALAADGVNLGADLTGFWGYTVGGQVLGSGHPGDSAAQFGVHAEIVDQAADGSYGTINIWNSMWEYQGSIVQTPSADPLMFGDTVDVHVNVNNIGAWTDAFAVSHIDRDTEFVSAYGGAYPLTAAEVMELGIDLGIVSAAAAEAEPSDVVGVAWEGVVGAGETIDYGFVVKVTSYSGYVGHGVTFHDDAWADQSMNSNELEIIDDGQRMVELPLLADTWVNGGDTATNFDAYAASVVRTTGLDNALLTFDRSALPEGVEILSAELMVNVTLESGSFGKELAVLNTEAFDTTTVTYDDAPAVYNPGDAVPVTMGMMTFDVAGNVAAWDAVGAQATEDSHMGQLAISATGPWGRIVFDSLETYQATPPMLKVIYMVD